MVLRRVAQIELESNPALRRRLGHFVVIGGGFSGVETAGELVECLNSLRRYYPRVARQRTQGDAVAGSAAAAGRIVRAPGTCGTQVAGGTRRRRAHERAGDLRHRQGRSLGRWRGSRDLDGDLHDWHAAEPAGRAHDAAHRTRPHRCEPDLSRPAHAAPVGHRRLRSRHQRSRPHACSADGAVRGARGAVSCAAICWRRLPGNPRALSAIAPAGPWRRSAIGRASPTFSAFRCPGCPHGCCGAPTTLRRCPRSAASCAYSSSGPGGCSSPTTSRICASTAAMNSMATPRRRAWRASRDRTGAHAYRDRLSRRLTRGISASRDAGSASAPGIAGRRHTTPDAA